MAGATHAMGAAAMCVGLSAAVDLGRAREKPPRWALRAWGVLRVGGGDESVGTALRHEDGGYRGAVATGRKS